MTSLWAQTININENLAKQLIESQNKLEINSIEILGEGWDNIAYLANEKLVFRFPKREQAIDCIKNEIALTAYIATQVTFPLSYALYTGEPTIEYPAPFAGYKILPGVPLCDLDAELIDDLDFAKNLALWLKELHAIPVSGKHNLQLRGDSSWRYDVKQRLYNAKKQLLEYRSYFIDAGFGVDALLIITEKLYKFEFDMVERESYIHGDLCSRHLLVNHEKKPSGIIDWGQIHIGSNGWDLAIGFMILSDKALKVFLDTYGVINNETRNVATLRAFCFPILLLPYCYEKKAEKLKRWTILALQMAVKHIQKNI